LYLLEQATRLYNPLPSSNSSPTVVHEDPNLVSKWFLVSLYCKTHSLPLSAGNAYMNPFLKIVGHLIELAEHNDWVTFLYEAETQGFPPEQVLRIVERHIADSGLGEHLALVILKLMRQKEENMSEWDRVVIPNPALPTDIFEIILAARNTRYPAKVLLLCAIEGKINYNVYQLERRK
jgi:hypothetical protein